MLRKTFKHLEMKVICSYQNISLSFGKLLSEIYTEEEITKCDPRTAPPFMIHELVKYAITLWNIESDGLNKVKINERDIAEKSLWKSFIRKKRGMVQKSSKKTNLSEDFIHVDSGIRTSNNTKSGERNKMKRNEEICNTKSHNDKSDDDKTNVDDGKTSENESDIELASDDGDKTKLHKNQRKKDHW